MIKFLSIREQSVLRNPLNGFAEEAQEIELRQDPLLGTWSRINTGRAKRVHQTRAGESAGLDSIMQKSREGCFFCMENVGKKTPALAPELGLGERMRRGTFLLVPNLYPFAKFHAVGILSKKHDATPAEITPKEWENALSGSIDYLRAVFRKDKKARFASINMNYMPPAAASIIHPHIQIICDIKPTVYQEALFEKSRHSYKKSRRNYFDALAREDTARRIGRSKKMCWIATFSPSAANDITGIFLGKSSFFELEKADIAAFAKELSRIFSAYSGALGARSINMSIFASPLDEVQRHFSLHARIISRPDFREFWNSDRGFLEVLHREPVVSTIPEDVAARMKERLQS